MLLNSAMHDPIAKRAKPCRAISSRGLSAQLSTANYMNGAKTISQSPRNEIMGVKCRGGTRAQGRDPSRLSGTHVAPQQSNGQEK